ncbi:MAG: GNAT family N-acetyltransferase [Caulobacter sp.]|nr:GNAT family N-acetyltransferase [Caulobacter sp.]
MLVERDGDLTLIAATLDSLDAEDIGGEALADLLGLPAPPVWPPEHNDHDTRNWTRDMMAKHPDEPGYSFWYIVADGELAGIGGYKGPPDAEGVVEIGYSVIEPLQRRGLATRAARLLVQRAFVDPRVNAVAAETLPPLIASQTVLLRCGFALAERKVDPEEGEVWRYRVARP